MPSALPVLIELDDPAPSPADAPPVPEAGTAVQAAAVVATGGLVLGRLAVWVLVTFAGFVVSVTVWDFVANLLARNSVLGSVGMALAVAAVLVLAVLALRYFTPWTTAFIVEARVASWFDDDPRPWKLQRKWRMRYKNKTRKLEIDNSY